MTTARHFKKLAEPLLARHADLVLVDGWILIKPVRHLLRGIIIDRTGSAGIFQPAWAVVHLCEPLDTFPLNWGERVHRLSPGNWRWDDPMVPDEFYGIVERETLPFISGVETLDDYVAFTGRDRFPLAGC